MTKHKSGGSEVGLRECKQRLRPMFAKLIV